MILMYDASTTRWSEQMVLGSDGGVNTDGPVPMEIDRVQQKGKGKSGKGKSKDKGFAKGQSKGKQKGKIDAQQCRICHEYGHWARECPNRVNQVEQVPRQSQQQMPLQPSPTSTMRTTLSNSSTSPSTVRRIYNIPMGIPTLISSS